jgi:CDP-diacylglycerol--glycerol-3-phosphate 3-phosphatidyltransferase
MRRVERAVYLDAGVVFVPVAGAVAVRFGLPAWVEHAPILLALAIVGGVGNVSAVRRLAAVARAVAARDGAKLTRPEPPRPAVASDPERDVPEDAVRDGVVS